MKGTITMCECISVSIAYFVREISGLNKGHRQQNDESEKTYQAARARGLGRLMPATLRGKRQLAYIQFNIDSRDRMLPSPK